MDGEVYVFPTYKQMEKFSGWWASNAPHTGPHIWIRALAA
jgi:hypothetical protein